MCVSACEDDLYEYINDLQNTQKQTGKTTVQSVLESIFYIMWNFELLLTKMNSSACSLKDQ